MFKMWKNKLFKRNMESYDIGWEELEQKRKEGAYIVDVRSVQEFKEGHLEGAINIPYYEINKNVYNILPDLGNTIILYCEAGVRSRKAYKKLKTLKYENVYNLYGGIDNWI